MENEIREKLAYLTQKNDIISSIILENESSLTEEDNKTHVDMMDEIYKSTKSITSKFEKCEHLYNDLSETPLEKIQTVLDKLIIIVENFENNLNELIEVKQNIRNLISGDFDEEDFHDQ